MGRLSHDQEQFFYSFRLDEAVPDDHPVREIAAVLDLSWVHSELAPYYSRLGRPSIDPVLRVTAQPLGAVQPAPDHFLVGWAKHGRRAGAGVALKRMIMNSSQQAIRDAAEKGGYRYRSWKVNDLEQNEGYNALQLRALSEHFYDRDFWQALATARKWDDPNAWRFHWHRFIDHLAEGKDAESFFATL